MNLVKLSIIAFSLGILVSSAAAAPSSETSKHDSTAVPAQTAPAANDSRPIPLTKEAAEDLAAEDSAKAAADSAAKAAPAPTTDKNGKK